LGLPQDERLLADTSTALFTLLPEVIWSTTIPEFQGGNLACKSVKFLQMLGPYLSSYTLCAMAWDRKQVGKFMEIVKAFKMLHLFPIFIFLF
jgi:hypothetical protein